MLPQYRRKQLRTKQAAKDTNYLLMIQSYCVRAERSAAQVLEKLHSLGMNAQEAKDLLATLQNEGYQNEDRFIAAYVADRTRLAGWGVNKVRTALTTLHGIAPAKVDEVLATSLDTEAYMHRLRKHIRPLLPPGNTLSPEARHDLMATLANKGYSEEEATLALEQVLAEAD
jgi:SOS response regulatory protein OraA/RecX